MELRVLIVLLFSTLILADTSPEENSTTDYVEEDTDMPCDKSLFHKKDILSIIDFVENTLSIRTKINDTIQLEAVPVLNKYIERMNSTIELLASSPEHLKHVLEHVSETRQYILQFAHAIEQNLTKLPYFTSVYQKKLDRKNLLLRRFQRSQKLCEINCGFQKVEFRQAVQMSSSEQYCGSVAEVHNTIREIIEKFEGKIIQDINEAITEMDEEYDVKIETVVRPLKDVVLGEFADPMYKILNLQDKYYHLRKDLSEFNTNWQMELREINIKADLYLLSLRNEVSDFENHCNNCNNVTPNGEEIEERQQVSNLHNEQLLDSLINDKLTEISDDARIKLNNIFHILDEILKKVNIDHKLLSHLNPIKEEITEIINKEIDAFNELRISNVQANIDLAMKLITDTKELSDAISENIEEIRANKEQF